VQGGFSILDVTTLGYLYRIKMDGLAVSHPNNFKNDLYKSLIKYLETQLVMRLLADSCCTQSRSWTIDSTVVRYARIFWRLNLLETAKN